METIKRKSLLYKSDVEYGNFCLNHVLGCSHGCLYPCYAFNLAKRYGKVKTRLNEIPRLCVTRKNTIKHCNTIERTKPYESA